VGVVGAWALAGLSAQADEIVGVLPEPAAITNAVELFDRRVGRPDEQNKDGFYISFGNMIPGAGWIAAGPGYRKGIWSRRATFTASGLLSWRLYSKAEARVDVARLGVDNMSAGAQVVYQDALQVNYFGLGNDTTSAARSGYRLRSTDGSLYAVWHPRRVTLAGRVGWTPAVELLEMTGRVPDYPDTRLRFGEASAPGVTHQSPFAHADVSAAIDFRDEPGHPSRGAAIRVGAAHYRERKESASSFTIYDLDVVGYVPLAGQKWVLGSRAWIATTSASAETMVPLYLLPNIGGMYTLRAYHDYRFTDRAAAVGSAESRWALFSHLDVAAFVDVGRTAPRPGQLGFSGFRPSYGVGVRFHNGRVPILRLDAAHGHEGWRVFVTTSQPMRRKTFSGDRTAVLPFVP
jgi:hypothetical protein